MKQKSPFLTIGIASYNYARYLPRAFEAIKRQKFQDFEILYCDDGSTDNSVEVIQKFIDQNPDMRIRLIQGQNGGVVANKKRILDNAWGQYVMVCDADDWMADNCLSILAAEARKSGADRIIGEVTLVDSRGKTIRNLNIANPSSKWMHTLWHGCLWNTDIFRSYDFGQPDDFYSDDYYYIQLYNLHCGEACFVREPVYLNCWHGENTTTVSSLNGKWRPAENFLQVMYFTKDIMAQITDEDVISTLRYQILKFYDQALCTAAEAAENFETLKSFYENLHLQFEKEFPDYLRNSKITLVRNNYDRFYGRAGVWGMAHAERLGVLVVLIGLLQKMKHRG